MAADLRALTAPGTRFGTQVRHLSALIRGVSWPMTVTVGFLVTAFVAALGYGLANDVLIPAGLTLGVFGAAVLWARHPSLVATLLVLVAFSVVLVPLAFLYALNADPNPTDESGPIVTLAATMVLVALLAHRTTLGRPWVSVALVAAALTMIGPVVMIHVRGFGFGLAWAIAALVLIGRGGGTRWARRALAGRTWRPGPDPHAPVSDESDTGAADTGSMFTRPRTAQAATEAILEGLDKRFHVLAARTDSCEDPSGVETDEQADGWADHVVLGPTGAFALDSYRLPGALTDDPETGLTYQGAPLAELLAETHDRAQNVTAALGLSTKTRALVVVHDLHLPAEHLTVVLTTGTNTEGDPTVGQVTLVSPAALLDQISGPPLMWSTRTARSHTRALREYLARGDGSAPRAVQNHT